MEKTIRQARLSKKGGGARMVWRSQQPQGATVPRRYSLSRPYLFPTKPLSRRVCLITFGARGEQEWFITPLLTSIDTKSSTCVMEWMGEGGDNELIRRVGRGMIVRSVLSLSLLGAVGVNNGEKYLQQQAPGERPRCFNPNKAVEGWSVINMKRLTTTSLLFFVGCIPSRPEVV